KAANATFFSERNPPEAHFVADSDGEILGYVRLKPPLDGVPECDHVMAIHGLDVSPHARRRGVATALMRAAEQAARSRRARKLSLRMLATNTEARPLYESLGYRVEGVLAEEFLIDGEYVDDVLMSLRLT
ncbi:MAG: GNAT family N-acetyltransferase, partial [Mycobacteriales bacterium]